ncbi:DUF5677 domain-containing protein [Ralstonia solanacearum]|uniref:DUF5677 domain-containing protein n=1 Tax=Ralstonia solanacearum TaxID=305 RepID=UPI003D8025E8
MNDSIESVREKLISMSSHFHSVCGWHSLHGVRSNLSDALLNLVKSSGGYLKLFADNLESDISVLALCARSLYENNLHIRYVLMGEDKLVLWLSEAITDNIQVLEGMLALGTEGDARKQRVILLGEIERLSQMRSKYQLPEVKRPSGPVDVAKVVGQEDEHQAFFKLYSKLVHPSSYLVNRPSDAGSYEQRLILQIQAQLYGWDAFERACDSLAIPADIRTL